MGAVGFDENTVIIRVHIPVTVQVSGTSRNRSTTWDKRRWSGCWGWRGSGSWCWSWCRGGSGRGSRCVDGAECCEILDVHISIAVQVCQRIVEGVTCLGAVGFDENAVIIFVHIAITVQVSSTSGCRSRCRCRHNRRWSWSNHRSRSRCSGGQGCGRWCWSYQWCWSGSRCRCRYWSRSGSRCVEGIECCEILDVHISITVQIRQGVVERVANLGAVGFDENTVIILVHITIPVQVSGTSRNRSTTWGHKRRWRRSYPRGWSRRWSRS